MRKWSKSGPVENDNDIVAYRSAELTWFSLIQRTEILVTTNTIAIRENAKLVECSALNAYCVRCTKV